MLYIKVQPNAEEFKRLGKALNTYRKTLEDMRPSLKELGRYIRTVEIPANFEQGGRPTKWIPRLPDKDGNVPDYPIMRQYNNLMGSLIGKEAETIDKQPYGHNLMIGTSEKHAVTHQEGMIIKAKTDRGMRFEWIPGSGNRYKVQRVKVPARPYMYVDPEKVVDLLYDSVARRSLMNKKGKT